MKARRGPKTYELIDEAYNGWCFASGLGGEELIPDKKHYAGAEGILSSDMA
jgi:hypothetical protein